MRKKRKLYVGIALLAVLGLVLTSLSGLFADNISFPDNDDNEFLAEYEKEIEELKEAIKEDPENIAKLEQLGDLYFEVAYLYSEMGDPSNSIFSYMEAFVAYRDALELDPEDNDLRIKKAMASHYTGNFLTAEATYLEAQERDPSHPGPYFHYGLLLYHMGDLKGAIEEWEALMELEEEFDQGEYPSIQPIIFTTATTFLEQARIELEEMEEDGETEEGQNKD